MAIYIEYTGVKGDVTAEGYKNHLAVDSFQFSVNRAISMETGNCVNRESTKPHYAEIVLTKPVDISSTALFQEASSGSEGKKVVIKFVQTGGDKVEEYLTYTLEKCLISSYSVSADSENNPIESFCLSYTSIEVTYANYDSGNKVGSPQRAGFNIELGKKI